MQHNPSGLAGSTPADGGNSRYCLLISPADPTIRVYDAVLNRPFLEWTGPIASELLRGGSIPNAQSDRQMAVGKAFIRSLMLAAAAAQTELDRGRPGSWEDGDLQIPKLPDRTLERRLGARELSLSGSHLCVARILFERRGEHLSEEDVTCLALLVCPSVKVETVRSCLVDLARWRIVQRVIVDEDTVVYDTETRPHLHVFDPVRRRLDDAPQRGVIAVSSGA